jgi:hypothetical protein
MSFRDSFVRSSSALSIPSQSPYCVTCYTRQTLIIKRKTVNQEIACGDTECLNSCGAWHFTTSLRNTPQCLTPVCFLWSNLNSSKEILWWKRMIPQIINFPHFKYGSYHIYVLARGNVFHLTIIHSCK